MTSLRLAFLTSLLLSCQTTSGTDSSAEPSDTEASPTSIQVAGDVDIDALADLCQNYDSVEVGGSANLTTDTASDLSAVSCLSSVTGNLVIAGETLETIDLPLLGVIGGDLVVEGLNGLTDLSMNRLEIIEGNLILTSNPYLQVANWDVICDVGTSIVVRDNANLQTLNLVHLERIQLALTTGRTQGNLQYTVDISNNPELETLDLSNLTTMDTSLIISNNTRLNQVLVGKTSQMGGELKIIDNPALTVINFESLTDIAGHLTMSNNVILQSAETDFASLVSINGDVLLTLLHNYNVPQFPALTTVAGSVNISDLGQQNDANLNLSQLTDLDGTLSIDRFAGKRIELDRLINTSDIVTFSNNPNLVEINISEGSSWGGLTLLNNDTMVNLASFATMGSLSGPLEIRNNQALQSVNQIQNITSISSLTKSPYEDVCEVDMPEILICGSPAISYEQSCALLDHFYETSANAGIAYFYEGTECPEICPHIEQHCVYSCASTNLDDDGDGYSEDEGDCDDSDPDIYPGSKNGAYPCNADDSTD